MSEYQLRIGKTDGVTIPAGKAKKVLLELRAALREAKVDAHVYLVPSAPKELD
jgi:hypothetical protein